MDALYRIGYRPQRPPGDVTSLLLPRVSTIVTIIRVAEQRTTERPRKSLVNVRVSADDRDLITRAAVALGKNRSEFMLDAARQAAQDALLDRTLFRLDSDRFEAFTALLDAPPTPNDKLKRLLSTPAPWER